MSYPFAWMSIQVFHSMAPKNSLPVIRNAAGATAGASRRPRTIAGAEDPQFAPGGFKILGTSAAFESATCAYDRYDTSVCLTLGLWGGKNMTYSPCI